MAYIYESFVRALPGIDSSFTIDASRETISVGKSVIVATVLFCFSFTVLSKAIRTYTRDSGIPKVNQYRLAESVWRATFCIVAVPYYGSHLIWYASQDKPDRYALSVLFDAVTAPNFSMTTNSTTEKDVPSDLLWTEVPNYVIPVAFLLHDLLITMDQHQCGLLTKPTLFLPVVLYCSFHLRCAEVGFHALFLVALTVGSGEVARAFTALASRKRGFTGPAPPFWLNCLSVIAFELHLVLWACVHMYLMPVLIHSVPSVLKLDPMLRSYGAFLNMALIAYCVLELWQCPLWRIIQSSPTSQGIIDRMLSLPSIVLLPHSDSLLKELYERSAYLRMLQVNTRPRVRGKRVCAGQLRSFSTSSGKETSAGQLSSGSLQNVNTSEIFDSYQGSQNCHIESKDETGLPPVLKEFSAKSTADLLSVVRCVMALKKKMRRRYEVKKGVPAESNCELGGYVDTPSSSPSTSRPPSESSTVSASPSVSMATYINSELSASSPLDPSDGTNDEIIDTFINVPAAESPNNYKMEDEN